MTNKPSLNILAVTVVMTLTAFHAQAQESEYRYLDAVELWRLTQNAAGLTIDRSPNRGLAEFTGSHLSGDFHRTQEGRQCNQLQFSTERYQKVSKYLMAYGRFVFNMDRTKDRAWCDVMRPYDANPYFPGSSVSGKYDAQQFDLTAALGTVSINGFRFGARLDYKVGDLSRLRDPRSRSELLHYRITPGVTWTYHKYLPWQDTSHQPYHTLGLSAHYDRRKEKIPNMTTVQEDPNLSYYQMSGMEQANGAVGGYKGFGREWVNHQLGAELSYQYQVSDVNTTTKSLNTVTIARAVEDAWGQYKFEPGRYTSYTYGLATHNRMLRKNLLHEIDMEASFTEAFADEYRQLLVQEKDPEKGYTSYHYDTQIKYNKRYQVKTYDISLHYRLSEADGKGITAYAGIKATLTGSKNKHLLPESRLEHQRLGILLEGGHAMMGRRLWFDATAGYSHASKADLQLSDPTTPYATSVLLPDMAYYKADYWQGQLSVKYLFPLNIKANKSTAYVKLAGEGIRADGDLSRRSVALSVGLFY